MDEMMNYNDISGTDRAKWKGDYSSYMDARNKVEGRYYYAYRCRSKAEENAGDSKRKTETTTAVPCTHSCWPSWIIWASRKQLSWAKIWVASTPLIFNCATKVGWHQP